MRAVLPLALLLALPALAGCMGGSGGSSEAIVAPVVLEFTFTLSGEGETSRREAFVVGEGHRAYRLQAVAVHHDLSVDGWYRLDLTKAGRGGGSCGAASLLSLPSEGPACRLEGSAPAGPWTLDVSGEGGTTIRVLLTLT